MQPAGGRHESGTQIRDRLHFSVHNELTILRIDLFAPAQISTALLVNRNAFTQPPRHFVLRQVQRHDMTELVPQNGLPIHVMRGRTIRRDHIPKANTEIAFAARHSESTHREIFWFGKISTMTGLVNSNPYFLVS